MGIYLTIDNVFIKAWNEILPVLISYLWIFFIEKRKWVTKWTVSPLNLSLSCKVFFDIIAHQMNCNPEQQWYGGRNGTIHITKDKAFVSIANETTFGCWEHLEIKLPCYCNFFQLLKIVNIFNFYIIVHDWGGGIHIKFIGKLYRSSHFLCIESNFQAWYFKKSIFIACRQYWDINSAFVSAYYSSAKLKLQQLLNKKKIKCKWNLNFRQVIELHA